MPQGDLVQTRGSRGRRGVAGIRAAFRRHRSGGRMKSLPLPGVLNLLGVLSFTVLSFTNAVAADAPAPAKKPPACTATEFHQFDFWIGQWDVTNPQGKPAGRNRIEAVLDGCAISEQWSGASGTMGRSYSAWDANNKRWTQHWVDTDGLVLFISGAFADGRMVMSGDLVDPASGKHSPQRVTWTPNADGSVRQLWESSTDEGKTWTVAFDGLYRRAK
jgi:hypothetical protein